MGNIFKILKCSVKFKKFLVGVESVDKSILKDMLLCCAHVGSVDRTAIKDGLRLI